MAPAPAPLIVVDVWCDMVTKTDRVRRDAFTRDIWRRLAAVLQTRVVPTLGNGGTFAIRLAVVVAREGAHETH